MRKNTWSWEGLNLQEAGEGGNITKINYMKFSKNKNIKKVLTHKIQNATSSLH